MTERTNPSSLTTSRVGLFQLLDALVARGGVHEDLDAPGAPDPIEFVHDTTLDYPPTDVTRCTPLEGGRTAVGVPLLGLVGAESPLPLDMTESVLAADDGGATSDFLDVFHARILQVVHAAWRTFGPGGTDTFRRGLRSFIGEDAFSVEAPATPAEELFGLGLSDVVECHPEYVNVATFELLLARAFPQLGARVSFGDPGFVGSSASDKAPLGIGPNILGRGGTYGRGTWDPTATLRIRTREFDDAAPVLPGGRLYEQLAQFAATWMNRCREVELDVPLRGEKASWTRLDGGQGTRLGFDAQVTRRRPSRVRMRVKVVTTSPRVTVRYVHDE